MKYRFLVLFSAAASALMVDGAALFVPQAAAQEPASSDAEIQKLIGQLGSETFELRQAATQRLMMRDDAISAVRRACKSPDAEIARRAQDILSFFSRRTNKRDFARLSELGKSGAIDQAVELLAQREEWEDEGACWQVMADFAQKIAESGRKIHEKVNLPDLHTAGRSDFDAAVRMVGLHPKNLPSPRPILWHGHLALRGKETLQKGRAMASLLAVSGKARAVTLHDSVIVSGDSVSIDDRVVNTLVICDGDFETFQVLNSIVLARGEVRCKHSARNSLIISGTNVHFDYPRNVVDTKVAEKEPKPLGFVHFFDPADVGIKVESAKGGVRVKEADKGKRFAAAGIQSDDVILAIEDDAVKDAETFRRLLRMNLALGGDFLLKVRRGDKELKVRLPEKN